MRADATSFAAVASAVLSVNLARLQPNPDKRKVAMTGIEKIPTSESVLVRAPGSKRDGPGSGLVGDVICDRANHGGDTQAVYAYAREDLDRWESVLGRSLAGGDQGEGSRRQELLVGLIGPGLITPSHGAPQGSSRKFLRSTASALAG